MEIEVHSSDECQKYWRDRFADQIQECIDAPWSVEHDGGLEAQWFREGMKYVMMIIRFDYDE